MFEIAVELQVNARKMAATVTEAEAQRIRDRLQPRPVQLARLFGLWSTEQFWRRATVTTVARQPELFAAESAGGPPARRSVLPRLAQGDEAGDGQDHGSHADRDPDPPVGTGGRLLHRARPRVGRDR